MSRGTALIVIVGALVSTGARWPAEGGSAAARALSGERSASARGGAETALEPQAPAFATEVRPILAEHCFECHGPDAAARKAGLRLDDGGAAHASGVLVAGGGADSLLARIASADASTVMPPPGSHRPLDDRQRAILGRWIAAGAPYEPHWAFVAPRAAEVPAGAHPVDFLVERRLARESLALAPEADRATLLRRATFDLTGLPPTPAEIADFLGDAEPGAWERVVDRLLASPAYGERMALPWLDAARYADSNGFQQDGDTFQWLWRDWLVARLNDDLPFDRLSTEMLAGDLLPDATDGSRLATAFLRNHLLNGEGGAIPEENRWVSLFDRVDAVATGWMGLTMSCAQCHDHKYDPVTQRDYYAFLDAFNRVPESGIVDGAPSRIRVAPPVLEYADDAMRARRAEFERAVADATAGEGGAESDAAKSARAALDRFLRDEWPRVMVMKDEVARETHVLSRGVYTAPGEKVAFATPAFLPPMADDWPRDRLGLARWLFDPAHPLVARVAVNRAWQVLFGEGLVRTAEDFGVQGEQPVHRELLDHLAVLLREDGWSMKRLHRLIATSRTYRQSSALPEELARRDPENRLLARGARFRHAAPILRDAALSWGGLLDGRIDGRIGGAPVYPHQPDGIWEPLAITKERDFTYPLSSGSDLWRRSLYTFWRRTIAPANMFDSSDRQTCRVRVPRTDSPLVALTMLNDPTWTLAARALAERSLEEARGDARAALDAAFARVLGRRPTDAEAALLDRMLARQEAALDDRTRALAAACLAILNLDEAVMHE